MQFTAAQIALIINGKVIGNSDTIVVSFGKIEEAQNGQLTFLANPKYEQYLYTTNASIIIVNETLQINLPINATLIKVSDAYSAFAILLEKYEQMKQQQLTGIQQPAYIAATAKIGANVYIGAFTYIGENAIIGDSSKIYPNTYLGNNVSIGENTIIHPGVKIYHDCVIGSRVTIHAGVVIGSDGFGFVPQENKKLKKIPQIGNVIIQDEVEIGANTTIDRATIGSTLIKFGAKLDNLLQIAHNVEVGNNTAIAALSGVSGSTKIGDNVMIGGQSGLAGHIQIADNTKIGGKSGVTKSIKKTNTVVVGNPAIDYTNSMRSQVIIKNLPALEQRVKAIENIIKEMAEKKDK